MRDFGFLGCFISVHNLFTCYLIVSPLATLQLTTTRMQRRLKVKLKGLLAMK